MRDKTRRRAVYPLFLLGSVVALGLTACEPAAEGGYPKKIRHTQQYIPSVVNPNPPPVLARLPDAENTVQLVATNLPSGVTQEMVNEGQKLYGTVCVACHGAGGSGGAAAPSLNDAEWLNVSGNFDEIVSIIHTGVANPKQYPGAMPALGGGNFDDEQVRALAAYVYALSHQGGA